MEVSMRREIIKIKWLSLAHQRVLIVSYVLQINTNKGWLLILFYHAHSSEASQTSQAAVLARVPPMILLV
jgi:hypothetical protein